MKKNILILFLITSVLFAPKQSEALCYKMASYGESGSSQSTPRTPLFDIRIFDGTEPGCFRIATQEETGVTSYNNGIQFLFDLMIGVSIALAVILFTFGAAEGIIMSGGIELALKNEKGEKIHRSYERMTNALVGLLVILGSWLVINTINPDLLKLPALQGLYQLNSTGTTGNPNTGVIGRPGN